MATGNTVKPLLRRTFDEGGLDNTFQPINALGTEAACFILRITNASDTDVAISFDGIHPNDWVVHGTYIEIEVQKAKSPSGYVTLWPKGLIVYVTNPLNAAGVGSIYLSGFYQ